MLWGGMGPDWENGLTSSSSLEARFVDDSRISGYPNEKLYTSSKVGGLLGGDVVRFC